MRKTKRNSSKKINEVEKVVGRSGNNGRIYLPKSWVRKKVKVTILR